MSTTHGFAGRVPMQCLTGIPLAALWLLFALAHVSTFQVTGRPSLLVFAVAETIIAAMFALRTPPRSFTTKPGEWAVALAGTFLPLLFRPTADTPVALAEWGLMLGSTLQIAGVLSLNRSFGIVPALRELKTAGLYRIVRHPIYASYLVVFAFYVGANYSLRNLVLGSVWAGLLIARIHFEERHLAQSDAYRAYRTRVKWRLIPFVY